MSDSNQPKPTVSVGHDNMEHSPTSWLAHGRRLPCPQKPWSRATVTLNAFHVHSCQEMARLGITHMFYGKGDVVLRRSVLRPPLGVARTLISRP